MCSCGRLIPLICKMFCKSLCVKFSKLFLEEMECRYHNGRPSSASKDCPTHVKHCYEHLVCSRNSNWTDPSFFFPGETLFSHFRFSKERKSPSSRFVHSWVPGYQNTLETAKLRDGVKISLHHAKHCYEHLVCSRNSNWTDPSLFPGETFFSHFRFSNSPFTLGSWIEPDRIGSIQHAV